jgi:hypothetical protein
MRRRRKNKRKAWRRGGLTAGEPDGGEAFGGAEKKDTDRHSHHPSGQLAYLVWLFIAAKRPSSIFLPRC